MTSDLLKKLCEVGRGRVGLLATAVGIIGACPSNLQAEPVVDNAYLSLSFIALHAYGYDLGLIFFAMSCVLTATLIYRSAYVPRISFEKGNCRAN